MENYKINILVEFDLSKEHIKLPYHTSDKFEIGNEKSAFIAICTTLDNIKQKAGDIFIRNLKIYFNGKIVFEKPEYKILNYTPALRF